MIFAWRDCTIVLTALSDREPIRWRYTVLAEPLRHDGDAATYDAAREAAITAAERLAAHRAALDAAPRPGYASGD